MAVYMIPLKSKPQSFATAFPSGVTYRLTLNFIFTPDPCWILDIADANGASLVCGIPLVTGADLLAQYAYLGFGCAMFVTTDGDKGAVPTWWGLGNASTLWLDDFA